MRLTPPSWAVYRHRDGHGPRRGPHSMNDFFQTFTQPLYHAFQSLPDPIFLLPLALLFTNIFLAHFWLPFLTCMAIVIHRMKILSFAMCPVTS